MPANAKLLPWPDFLPKWETLNADQKKLYLRQIDVWAAYVQRPKWQGPDALPPGKHTVVFDWKPDPEGAPIGRGGAGALSVNGKEAARLSLPQTQPFIWAWDGTFDVGLDAGTSVDDSDYAAPFPFTGKLEKITFDRGETLMTPEAIKAMMEELAKKRDR